MTRQLICWYACTFPQKKQLIQFEREQGLLEKQIQGGMKMWHFVNSSLEICVCDIFLNMS